MRAAGMEPPGRYLSSSSYYDEPELQNLLVQGVGDTTYDPLALHRSDLRSDRGGDELVQLLYLDAKTFLWCLNLTYTDKMGMAASVEVRVPLLDDELVAWAVKIPSSLKLRGWRREYIFKRSQEEFSLETIWRRKAGLGAPLRVMACWRACASYRRSHFGTDTAASRFRRPFRRGQAAGRSQSLRAGAQLFRIIPEQSLSD
jgi:asparagine synthetase B (glutamine-hydrolysing)